jgi:glycosyltransferase involved in cell wall biosynthesis
MISICVCTYRRPKLLESLLRSLEVQDTKGRFRYSITVIDNDSTQSARSVVESWSRRSKVPTTYAVEPRQNIALARNASVEKASGEYVAFIDDDEEASSDWLYTLYQVLIESGADGVLGPVLPRFEEGAPEWAKRGKVFARPSFKTGTAIHWSITGAGNVLIKRSILQEVEPPFDPQLGAGGEDTDFFRRAMARGRVFVWSAEAVCHEWVPRERTRVAFQLRRALLRGKIAFKGPGASWRGVFKSAIAVPVYAIVLPASLIMGSHVFVTCLVRSFDHLGKLLTACGINVAGDKYIS